jgi:hypothetical protein
VQILTEVPLPFTELDVCRAVEQWAIAEFSMDIDLDDDEEGEHFAGSELLITSDQERNKILDAIDLSYVNPRDIREVRIHYDVHVRVLCMNSEPQALRAPFQLKRSRLKF